MDLFKCVQVSLSCVYYLEGEEALNIYTQAHILGLKMCGKSSEVN